MFEFNPFKKPFQDGKVVKLKVNHVLHHLCRHDAYKLQGKHGEHFEKWQNAKEVAVIAKIDAGKKYRDFKPIELHVALVENEYKVNDGISRLRAFKTCGFKHIKAQLYHG